MQQRKERNWKKIARNIALATTLLVAAPVTAKLTEASEQSELETIQHIYMNGTYVGKATDEKVVQRVQQQLIAQYEQQYDGLQFVIQDDVTFVPETVFSKHRSDAELETALAEQFTVEAQSQLIKIGDTRTIFVQTEEEAQQVERQLKLSYVTEEELAAVEQGQPLPIEEGHYTLVDIQLKQPMTTEAAVTNPDRVLTVKEAVRILKNGAESVSHVMTADETLQTVAAQYDVSPSLLRSLNPDKTFGEGERIVIERGAPKVQIEKVYETKEAVTIPFERVTEKDSTMLKGEDKVAQEGKDGKKLEVNRLIKVNGEEVSHAKVDEEVIEEPINEVTKIGTKEIPSRGTGSFAWPAVGGYVSSGMGYRWGRMHEGIDIARPSNRSILAADNGTVKRAGSHPTYGNYIVITHNNGYETLYGHLASIQVRSGQVVSKGSTIGVMGSTGRSTGIHLHFEVRKNGALVNPLSVLR